MQANALTFIEAAATIIDPNCVHINSGHQQVRGAIIIQITDSDGLIQVDSERHLSQSLASRERLSFIISG